MFQRFFMIAVLLLLVATWFIMPRVTQKDAVAYAHAMFLEYCNSHNLNPEQFKSPDFHVEGGDKDLIFVYQYKSDSYDDSLRVKINKGGDYQFDVLDKSGKETRITGETLKNTEKRP